MCASALRDWCESVKDSESTSGHSTEERHNSLAPSAVGTGSGIIVCHCHPYR